MSGINFIKLLWIAIALPLNIILLAIKPSIGLAVNLYVILFFTAFWTWEWRSKLKAEVEIQRLISILPHMTKQEQEEALARIARCGVTLKFSPYDIAKLFKLID